MLFSLFQERARCATMRLRSREKPTAMHGKLGTALLTFAVVLLVAAAYPHALVAGAASASTGTPGAIITQRNWQRYRQFMSEGLVALFEGKQFWHLPADLQIEVGPTISIPLPKKYLDDTVRYSNRVKLIRTSSGGYVPIGYVAGLPFPHPLEGDPASRTPALR